MKTQRVRHIHRIRHLVKVSSLSLSDTGNVTKFESLSVSRMPLHYTHTQIIYTTVKDGHFVKIYSTKLPHPELVIVSESMMKGLGLVDADVKSKTFLNFFSAC